MQNRRPHVEILLATYNSAAFGPEMLDSILAQTHVDYTLLVRDDGSTDGTVEMLADYEKAFSGRMKVIDPQGAPTCSAKGNFSLLMDASCADYVLFADGDDVWKPEKVALTLELLRDTEAKQGSETPVYVFTDVTPVDAKLSPIQDSFWDFKRINPRIAFNLPSSLVCPAMLGCASGVNRALINKASPVPCDTVTGHDWWSMLVAIVFGVTAYSPERTMYYRLHGANSSAQSEVSAINYAKTAGKFAKVRRGMNLRRQQAQSLIDVFGDQLPTDARTVIETFTATCKQNFLQRRLTLLRGGYLYPDLPRNLAMLVAA